MFWLKPEYLEPRWSFRVKMHFLYFEFDIEPSREQYDEVKEALKLARADFLQWSQPRSWMANREMMPRLRGLLHDAGRNAPNMWDDEWVVHAVHHEVRMGNLIFAPPKDRLKEYIQQVRNERQRRARTRSSPAPIQHAQPSDAITPSQLYRQRVPLDTPSNSSGESRFDVWDAPGDPFSTPLSDAQPFEYSGDNPLSDVQDIAARGISEGQEAECFAEYERALDLCNALGGPMGAVRGVTLCRQNAFDNYQQCRGF
ncbi:hypothetical protein GCT13_12310 [Paraburkholderia sp. CNPSo 3157]|uniref:Uncharacterized protein n=1 Tax=Paraburkholderia franconis TaxID=2654983 RepID=A0A7X1N953_9BURK|nr:hypothetical protein [Paraburkholderia franconis]MPW17694.1 hypothetical protein [Paraburkholderia franconis]